MTERDRMQAEAPRGVAPTGFRMPDATRLGRVRLQVSDLERSLHYYQRVLGLRLGKRADAGASLRAHPDDATLVELRERKGAAPVPRGGRPGLYHFAILVPGRAALGRFLHHLEQIGEPAGASDHLVSEALYLRDPDGLGIEVYADRPRSSWTQRNGQLVMATEPLDMASLLSAAGSEPWTGMPARTVVGHVHLHVGDITRAAAFYHDGLGFDRTVWDYPGALFLSAGGYHHHLGLNTWATNPTPAGEADARLLDWEIVVPSAQDAHAAMTSLTAAGHAVERTSDGGIARDPWSTAVRVRAASVRP